MVGCTLVLVTRIITSFLGTMTQLTIRKQRYKLTMFKRLYYILLAAAVVIAVFFGVSSVSFSDRLAEGTFVG
jgi:hypothetical protein